MTIRFLDPSQPAEVLEATLARRQLPDRPLVLGLLSNAKTNAGRLLRLVAEGLGERVAVERTVEVAKPSASTNAPDDLLDQLVEECDLAVVAVGD